MHLETLGRRLASVLLIAAVGLAPARAAIITVDSDTDDGTGGCTLREAVEAANTDSAVGGCTAGDDTNDIITFDAGVSAITLSAGQITITEALSIEGGDVTITAGVASRIFEVQGSEFVLLEGLALQGGASTSATGYPDRGGAIYIPGDAQVDAYGVVFSGHVVTGSGGAVWVSSSGRFTTVDGAFTGNRAQGDAADQGGGAVYTDGGDLSFQADEGGGTTFTDNRALGISGSGGAILNPNGAIVDVIGATFTLNRAQRAGGAIESVGGSLLIFDAVFDRGNAGTNPGNGGAVHVTGGGGGAEISGGAATANRGAEGGAFWVGAGTPLTLTDVDVTGNLATGAAADQGGGGIYVDGGTLEVSGGAISDNRAIGTAGSGGGLFVNGGTVTLTGTTVAVNRAQRAGGGIEIVSGAVTIADAALTGNVAGPAPGNGGGVHTTAGPTSLDIAGTLVSENDATAEGGGLWINAGTALTLVNSDLTDNIARAMGGGTGGGGLFVNGGDALVATTAVTGNRALGRDALGGGVLVADGSATIEQALIAQNEAYFGGGLAVLAGASAGVENTTVYANTGRFGGGGYSQEGAITFDSATIAANVAQAGGGGLYNRNPPNGGVPFVTLRNSIVADNTAQIGPDLKGRHGSDGWNVIGTAPPASTFPAQPSDQTGTDPMLEPLADNGGPTDTAALMAGSPAIDSGQTALAVDQRGVARTEPDDVGAVEFGDAGTGDDPTLALVLTGVVDGPLSGGVPKAAEIYVAQDVSDLSLYAIGSANNGGGTDGPEFYLTGSASAGDYLYVASETPGFTEFFGFAPDFTSGALAINGDDAVELFYDDDGSGGGNAAMVVDTFGDINATTGGWIYTDGWAYRNDGTGPDGGTFVEGNFTYSGVDALDGETTNATAATPWPIGTYSPDGDGANVRATPASALAETMTEAVRLDAVTPNPFGSRAAVGFAVREAQPVTVGLYDVMGRRVQTLYAGSAQAEAPVDVAIDGSGLAAGVYVVVLQGETVRATRRVTVVR
jgi:CSLREA domain-containing protein